MGSNQGLGGGDVPAAGDRQRSVPQSQARAVALGRYANACEALELDGGDERAGWAELEARILRATELRARAVEGRRRAARESDLRS